MQSYFDKTMVFEDHELFDYFSKKTREDFDGLPNTRIKKEIVRKALFNTLGKRNLAHDSLKPIDGSSLRRVLLFRYDAIGDYIVTTPLIRWLKSMSPGIKVDVITSHRNDFMIRRDPNIDKTFAVHPSKNFVFSWKPALKSASKNNYDIIFGLVFTYMSKCAVFASYISRVAEKITVMHDERKDIYGKVFNRQVFHPTWKEHWAKTMIRAAKENILFNKPAIPGSDNPYIFIYGQDYEAALQHALKHDLKYNINTENILLPDGLKPEAIVSGRPYCIVNISAFSPNRQLSPGSTASLCKMLVQKYKDLHIFVTGGPTDRDEIISITDSINNPNCTPLLMQLNTFIAFTAGADFIITPDTATTHIAAAAGVPVVGLYAELIKAAEWYPYNTHFAIVLSKDPHTINAIEPEKILEGVEKVF